MSRIKNQTNPKLIHESDLIKSDCKNCVIGGYIQMKFRTKKGERAMCKLCEGKDIDATFLPMKELHKILNKPTFTVKKKVFTPSINNYCSKCGEELYDDGKAEECYKCKAPAVKHFTEKIEFIPSHMFKHQFNKLYTEFKNILIQNDKEE